MASGRVSVWRLLGGLAGLVVLGGAAVVALYLTAPRGTMGPGPVDVLLVLGTPAGMHGEPTEMERWRVNEAVREFRRGVAPYVLFSGGPTSHGWTEATVMSRYGVQQGLPPDRVLGEGRSLTTLENIRNSERIMHAHGWNTVEVISTREHLPRAAVILAKEGGLRWRTHIAPTPNRGWADTVAAFAEEAVGTAALRVFGEKAEPVLHMLARGQHGVGWCVRWVLFRVSDWIARRQ